MYADYDYYLRDFRGKLSADDYVPLAEKAGAYIDSKTDWLFHKKGLPAEGTSLADRLKKCACAITDELHRQSTGTGMTKTSEKVGDYSVSFAAVGKSDDERLWGIIEMYIPDAVKAVGWI